MILLEQVIGHIEKSMKYYQKNGMKQPKKSSNPSRLTIFFMRPKSIQKLGAPKIGKNQLESITITLMTSENPDEISCF